MFKNLDIHILVSKKSPNFKILNYTIENKQ